MAEGQLAEQQERAHSDPDRQADESDQKAAKGHRKQEVGNIESVFR